MKNHLRANHCNQCGKKLVGAPQFVDADGRAKLYADIAHPINSDCRDMIQESVIAEFHAEIERAKQPGYVSRYEDYDYDDRPPQTRIDRAHSDEPTRAPHSPPNNRVTRGAANGTGGGGSGSASTKPDVVQDGGFGAGIFD
jgi:stage V sporulation protein G